MTAYLVLESGRVFAGESFGYPESCHGEVVFNTSMTGYQEIMTDPSYCGQIVVLTYPLIGNYGINPEDFESEKPWVTGLIVHEACRRPSNWRASKSLEEYLKENRIPAIKGLDTRSLTRYLRYHGTMRGMFAYSRDEIGTVMSAVKSPPPLSGDKLVPAVMNKEAYTVEGGEKRIVLINCGVKENILRCLRKFDCTVIVLPATAGAEEIMAAEPHGVVLSNGPGDPKDVLYTTAAVKKIISRLPVMGICLGHQLLALAVEADTYKLPFGHRGGNHPVKDLRTGRVYITSQNHGYAVKADTLPREMIVSHINLNDGTVEGLRHKHLPVFSVQYHPESSPGPTDSEYLFHDFMAMVDAGRLKGGC